MTSHYLSRFAAPRGGFFLTAAPMMGMAVSGRFMAPAPKKYRARLASPLAGFLLESRANARGLPPKPDGHGKPTMEELDFARRGRGDNRIGDRHVFGFTLVARSRYRHDGRILAVCLLTANPVTGVTGFTDSRSLSLLAS